MGSVDHTRGPENQSALSKRKLLLGLLGVGNNVQCTHVTRRKTMTMVLKGFLQEEKKKSVGYGQLQIYIHGPKDQRESNHRCGL